MFGSEILEVASGLVFVYLFASLVATAVREAIEGIFKTRAIHLERGVRQLLDDPDGDRVTRQLFDHPLLYSLFAGRYEPAKLTGFLLPWRRGATGDGRGSSADTPRRMGFFTDLPSYIPSRNFALALMHIVAGAGEGGGTGELSLNAIRTNVQLLPDSRLKQALLVALAESEGDFDRARASLEAWFDGTMDRVSGWYKRETSWILFGIGLVTAVALNIDTVEVARSLATNNSQRQALVAHIRTTAPAMRPDTPLNEQQLRAETENLSTIIGYSALQKLVEQDLNGRRRELRAIAAADLRLTSENARASYVDDHMPSGTRAWMSRWLQIAVPSLPGWVISALAISLGAPFWFDTLNKLMVIRSTVKPYEKSPAEGSADRGAAPGPVDLLIPAGPPAGNPAPPRAQPATRSAPTVEAPSPVEANIRLAFDLAGADQGTLALTRNGASVPVPPDALVELPLEIGVAHELTAIASASGKPLRWSRTFVPTPDDEARPIDATLT